MLFSRLLIQNKELDCREDPEMQDLKEDVVKLSNLLSQLKTQKLKLTFLEDAEVCLTYLTRPCLVHQTNE